MIGAHKISRTELTRDANSGVLASLQAQKSSKSVLGVILNGTLFNKIASQLLKSVVISYQIITHSIVDSLIIVINTLMQESVSEGR